MVGASHWRRRRPDIGELVRAIPSDRLLVETDAPYQPPPDAMCRESLPDPADHHPANITAVLRALAKERSASVQWTWDGGGWSARGRD